MTWKPSRRSVLTTAGGLTALAATSGGAMLALGAGPNGLARSIDTTDSDDSAEMVLRRERRPPGDRSGPAVNATTGDTATTDYAVSLARVDGEQLTLGDLADDGFGYDYYEGSASTDPGPDEVWVVLTSTADGRQGRHAVFRKEEDTRGAETWRTRDVAPELQGSFRDDGSGEPWREFHLDDRSIETVGDDLLDAFGRDAKVQMAGIGRGSPGWKSFVADTYYDGFTVAGHRPTLPVTGWRGRGSGQN